MNDPVADPGRRRREITGLLSGVGLFVLLLVLPLPEGLTSEGKTMLAIAALMAVWWLTEALPIPATALLPIVVYPLFGIMPVTEAARPYSNHLIFLFLGGFLIAIAIERVNLHQRIALHVIRLIGDSASKIVLGFMVATALLSMWISNTATALMMLPIALAVIGQTSDAKQASDNAKGRSDKQRGFALTLLLGIAYAASIGGVGTLIGTPPNIILAGMLEKLYPEAPSIGFLQWLSFAFPLVVIFLPLTWWFLVKVISRHAMKNASVLFSGEQNIIASRLKQLGSLRQEERRVLLVFLLTATAWIFRQPLVLAGFSLPGLTDIFPWISDSVIAMTAGISLFLIPSGTGPGERRTGPGERRTGPGERGKSTGKLLDWSTVQRGLPWGILLLFGGGFALGEGLKSTGVTLFLGSQVTLLQGVPVLVIIVLICLLMTFTTELTSNTATASILIPVVAAAAVSLDQHPLLFMIPAALNASFAFMLPVATPPNAIVFSSSLFDIRDMAKAGLLLNVVGAALVTAAMYLAGMSIFGITSGMVPFWAR